MLRSDLALKKQRSGDDGELIKICHQLGGTLFEACYTTAPDTYRSLGSFWSSLYPKMNGCDNRNKKTYDFLRDPNDSFLGKLKKENYTFNLFSGTWETDKIGIFPNVYNSKSDRLSTGLFLDDYLDEIKVDDDTITFFNLEDLHFILDDGKYTAQSYAEGIHKVCELINRIFEKKPCDVFDEIIMFSDHGFRFCYEDEGDDLDGRRSNIFLFWHHRGDRELFFDRKIRSIMDVYPTLLDCCKVEYDKDNIEGKSLLDTEGHDYLVLEDHSSFYASYLQPVNKWAIVDSNGMYFIDEDYVWKDSDGHQASVSEEYSSYLIDKATNFSDMIWLREKNLEYSMGRHCSLRGFLSDGTKREVKKVFLIHRIYSKVNKILKKLKYRRELQILK